MNDRMIMTARMMTCVMTRVKSRVIARAVERMEARVTPRMMTRMTACVIKHTISCVLMWIIERWLSCQWSMLWKELESKLKEQFNHAKDKIIGNCVLCVVACIIANHPVIFAINAVEINLIKGERIVYFLEWQDDHDNARFDMCNDSRNDAHDNKYDNTRDNTRSRILDSMNHSMRDNTHIANIHAEDSPFSLVTWNRTTLCNLLLCVNEENWKIKRKCDWQKRKIMKTALTN